MPDIFQDTHYLFDGGSLLQRFPWTVGRTFDEICQSFKHYLLNSYGRSENITVVFDGGYLVPSARAVHISDEVKEGQDEKLYHHSTID